MSCCKYVTICGLIYASNVSQCSEFLHAWFLDLQVLSSRYFCSLVSVYILCISLIYFFACVSVVASCYLKSSISDAFYLVLLHFSCCSWLMLALFLFAFLRVKIFPLPLVKFFIYLLTITIRSNPYRSNEIASSLHTVVIILVALWSLTTMFLSVYEA